jgi:hypothetical protein
MKDRIAGVELSQQACEAETKRADTHSPEITKRVRSPPTSASIDTLFVDPIHPSETKASIKALKMYKRPGPDGITNRMLAGGGVIFRPL